MTANEISHLAEDLNALDQKIAQMGGLAEQALGQSIDALGHHDPDLGIVTMNNDHAIDSLERSIEELGMSIIAKQQLLKHDLRRVITAIRIATDLERIGGLAMNIAKQAIVLSDEATPKQVMVGFMHIGETALSQLKDVLDAYSQRDSSRALKVWQREQQIDAIYNSLYDELLKIIADEPKQTGLYTQLLFGAKNLERIGDHATNIAKKTYFLINGTGLDDGVASCDDTTIAIFGGLRPAYKH